MNVNKPLYIKQVNFKLTEKQNYKLEYILSRQENTKTEFLRQLVIKYIQEYENKHGLINDTQMYFK